MKLFDPGRFQNRVEEQRRAVQWLSGSVPVQGPAGGGRGGPKKESQRVRQLRRIYLS